MSIKKVEPNKVSKNVGYIAEIKKRALLKFSNENHTKSYEFYEMLNSNVLNKTGMC